jgi:putative MATE family efflux protein
VAKSTRELTKGTIWKQIVSFAIPLLLASLIQLLYNFVNQVFAGQFIGTNASAAIAASGLLVACLVNFFNGLGVGASVIVARHFVKNDHEDYSKALHTTFALALTGGIALTVIGIICAPIFLAWLQTPELIFDDAVLYLRIFFISTLPMVMFNLLAGVIRALGNSKSPMYYQLLGGLLNLLINILLVTVLGLGLIGPAIATVFAQSLSALLAIRYLFRLEEQHRMYPNKIHFHGDMLAKILKIGVPAGIQMMSITLSNLIIQSQINTLSVAEIAGFAYYFQLESFIYNPILAIGQTVMVFTSHNLAANQPDRARKGIRTSMGIGVGIGIAVAAFMLLIAPQCFGLFSTDPDAIAAGITVMQTTYPFYFFYAFIETFSNAARGSGRSWQPMAIVLGNMCGLRLVLLFVFMHFIGGIRSIAMVYPPTWAAAGLMLMAYYFLSHCIDKPEFADKNAEE